MTETSPLVADVIKGYSDDRDPVKVSLSNELVGLLSEQLYQSPVKAIEELVVNSYDADATECRIYVPQPSDNTNSFVVIFDNGMGMDKNGLINLWQIGRSNKRNKEIERRQKRKLIGRFGIGKLATYAIANRLTYITKNNNKILSVSIDFRAFTSSPTGTNQPIDLPVREITDWAAFEVDIKSFLSTACIEIDPNAESWTLAILEELKEEKSAKLRSSLLKWILSTAMPYASDFQLFLNCEEVVSSKEEYEKYIEFNLTELPQKRIDTISKATGEEWKIKEGRLTSKSFPSGITGHIIITKRTLLGGKSDDLARSHGFFIRVRGRLINANDALFLEKALIHGVFNRFRADIEADDLDSDLKASREAIDDSTLKTYFRLLLREIFNEAAARYEIVREVDPGNRKPEGEKTVVAPVLVEFPMADALIEYSINPQGAEANESWFYFDINEDSKLSQLAQELYTNPRSRYNYKYTQFGETERVVKFEPETSTFWINEDHQLALEYAEGPSSVFLEDFVTAEAMLEIYLREAQVPPHIIGEVLERRDALLRSLAKDHAYSLKGIAKSLRDAEAEERELEILLVVATRALGFVSQHVSNRGKPDGIARFSGYDQGEKRITLEAKSSTKVPDLKQIDFAGIKEHMEREGADGCLLVSPTYPGNNNREDNSAVAHRAKELEISCWTVEQLARFIEAAETHQLNANHLLDIVLKKFSPQEVSTSIENLLSKDTSDYQLLYVAVIRALRELEPILPNDQRTVQMIAPVVVKQSNNAVTTVDKVRDLVMELSNSSQGAMQLRDDNIHIHVSLDELERRVSGLTKQSGEPRRKSNFRTND